MQPLLRRIGSGQRVSLYTVDVVLFMQLCLDELGLVKETLRFFGMALGLVMNIRKVLSSQYGVGTRFGKGAGRLTMQRKLISVQIFGSATVHHAATQKGLVSSH
jgi:hypothetical protein